jgi:hypothetical protein
VILKFKKESQKIHYDIVKLENLLNTLVLEESNKELLKKIFKHFVTHMDISNKDKLELIKTCVKLVIVSKENYENKIRIIYKFE